MLRIGCRNKIANGTQPKNQLSSSNPKPNGLQLVGPLAVSQAWVESETTAVITKQHVASVILMQNMIDKSNFSQTKPCSLQCFGLTVTCTDLKSTKLSICVTVPKLSVTVSTFFSVFLFEFLVKLQKRLLYLFGALRTQQ